MRRHTLFCCAALALATGCAKSEKAASDTAMADAAPAPPPAAITLADVAGKWNQSTRAENSDSVLLTSVLTATADTTGWTLTFPNRAPVPMRVVTVGGDSIVTVSGPYESALRKGVKVTTTTVMRLQDGKLVSRTVAHYQAPGADSVRRLRSEATRAP